jgi:hypothetical protein
MIVLSEQATYDVKRGLSALSTTPFILSSLADSASFYDHVVAPAERQDLCPGSFRRPMSFSQY